MTISNERLQHVLDMCANYSDEEVSAKLGKKVDTIRRYKDEARKRGLKSVEEHVKLPKILLLDIETSLMRFWGWSPGKQYVGPDQIETDWHMLGWAVKWLFDANIYSDILTPQEAAEHNDKRVVDSLWKYLDEADIVIAHNALGFDIPKIMARIISHNQLPPSPYQIIDTLTGVRSIARFSSNKQDELAKKFGLRRKVEHEGYSLWTKCFSGDPEALLTMERYNRGDTTGLEDLYLYLRPYLKNHPNLALYMDNEREACYKCGSPNLEWPEGKFYYTTVNKFSVYRCQECGSHGRSRKTAVSKQESQYITSPIAR